ncbi:helix-turn-helix transcriptional regulator [Marinicrinis lubricantis]|uniref:helix-turn-helix transcriptional regulator n=1 Tax=Marinicrinis lubricantis TaxID=2086470 RepID=UPI0039EFECEA
MIELVKKNEPVIGDQIAEMLGVSKPTIRSDLSILVMLDILKAKPKVGYFIGERLQPASQNAEKLRSLKVKDVYQSPVIVKETVSVHDSIVTLFLENTDHLIVINEKGILSGIVSRKDFLKVTLGNSNTASIPVSMVMTRQPKLVTVTPEEQVVHAAEKLLRHEIDSLPVVQETEQGEYEVLGNINKSIITQLYVDFVNQTMSS